MTVKVKSRVEIVLETGLTYHADPTRRAITIVCGSSKCVYHDENTGHRCALGRCLTDEAIASIQAGDKNLTDAESLFDQFGFDILKPEYRIEDVAFWETLQSFHDRADFWTKNGITRDGLEALNRLLDVALAADKADEQHEQLRLQKQMFGENTETPT